MARALAQGMVAAGRASAETLWASDPNPKARALFHKATGGHEVAHNRTVVENCDTVVIAIKPVVASLVLNELRTLLTEKHLVISIMAGVSLDRLRETLGDVPKLVRVMPNTPCLVQAGASGYSLGAGLSETDHRRVDALLSSVGIAVVVPEYLLDAVTGLSGSGPAYVFTMIEALSDGGVRQGLSRDVATKLAAQTLMGAAQMVLQTGQHPGVLKDMVTSAGGTTAAGLAELERRAIRSALNDAVAAATKRSIEMRQHDH